jgi:hypothetical protein
VALCSQKNSKGPLYKFGKVKSTEEMELPKQAFAVIPISDVFERVSGKLSDTEKGHHKQLASCYDIAMARGHVP